jgi:hypothetical protein
VTRDELEAMFERARNPALVPGIYNYCLRRCGRCPFTSRCFAHLEDQRTADRSGGDLVEGLEEPAQAAVDLMRLWCEREGIEPDTIGGEPMAGAVALAEERSDAARAAVECDQLYVAAKSYEAAAYAVVDPLRRLSPFHEWPLDVADALDTISWNAGAIRAKVYRALCGLAESGDELAADPIQNDWNGSAKVARLAIADSLSAWDVLFVAGETPHDAPIRARRRELEEMDEEIGRRFPHAMTFVRPGFDEPEVAAGALTSAAPFDPRRQTIPQRIRRWLAARCSAWRS